MVDGQYIVVLCCCHVIFYAQHHVGKIILKSPAMGNVDGFGQLRGYRRLGQEG
jgi:hypothetical protein